MVNRFRREGFLNYEHKSSGWLVDDGLQKGADLVLQNGIECLNDTRRVPPLWGLDLIGNGSRRRAALGLYLANRSKTSSREGLFEFTRGSCEGVFQKMRVPNKPRNAMIRMIVALESSQEPLSVLVTLLLLRHETYWRRRATPIFLISQDSLVIYGLRTSS